MSDKTTDRARCGYGIWLVLVLAFLIRAALLVGVAARTGDMKVHRAPDTKSYVGLAQELYAKHTFTRGGEAELARTPGYPLVLLPGVHFGKLELLTVCLQIVLSSLTACLVYKTGMIVFERRGVAALCGVLYAIEPLSVAYASKLLAETVFTFLIAAFLCALASYLKHGGVLSLLVSAVALSSSAYVRPISYFLPPLVAFGLVLRWLLWRPKRRRLLVHALVFFLLSAGHLALWQVRNAQATGYCGFSSVLDKNLYFYQGAAVLAAAHGEAGYYQTQNALGFGDEAVYLERHPDQVEWTRAERYRYMRREGARILTEQPWAYAKIHLKGMARALLDPGAFEYLKLLKKYEEGGGLLGVAVDEGLLEAVIHTYEKSRLAFRLNLGLGLLLAVYVLCAVAGVCSRQVLKNPTAYLILLTALYFLVASGGPQATGRFRHPAMPMICLLAACGLAAARRRGRRPPAKT